MSEAANTDPTARAPSEPVGEEQLGDAIDPREPRQKSILNIISGILAVRAPTRLVVDGMVCLVSWLVVGAILGALRAGAWQAARAAQSPELGKPLYWLELVPSTFYYIGLVLIAVGCCRMIADKLPGPPRRLDEDSP